MRNRLAVVLALSCLCCACKRDKESGQKGALEQLYGLDRVGEVKLELSPAARDSLTKSPKVWVEATATVLGKRVERVGVRIKGHRSRRAFSDKPALKISFDRYAKGRTVHGVSELVLNNMVEDPTMMREFLGYRLYRAAKVPAPRVGYVNVFIDDELRGLYALVESPDATFLAEHFPGKPGKLYEGEYGCDLYPADVDGIDQDFGKKGRKKLRALAAAAERGADALFYDEGHPVDTEEFLAYLAVSAFIADFDGYRHAHNYRLYYHPATKRWQFLPWGIDRSFKRDLDIHESYGLAARLCFRHQRCHQDYLRTLARITDEFAALDFTSGIDVVATITAKFVELDPKRPYPARAVHLTRQKLRRFVVSRPKTIRKSLACLTETGERDADNDGFGCLDCDDNDPNINPGAQDICGDDIDQDCSGLADDWPQCDCEKIAIEGVDFDLCSIPRSWHDAREHCRAKGKNLASFDSPEQSVAVFTQAQARRKERWWIGLNDHAKEGEWLWADDSKPKFAFWHRGEPDNGECNQDCGAIHEDHEGRWSDSHCARPRPFICR